VAALGPGRAHESVIEKLTRERRERGKETTSLGQRSTGCPTKLMVKTEKKRLQGRVSGTSHSGGKVVNVKKLRGVEDSKSTLVRWARVTVLLEGKNGRLKSKPPSQVGAPEGPQ